MRAILHLWQLTYFEWALREVHPLHDDVPEIVRRINHLRRQLGAQA